MPMVTIFSSSFRLQLGSYSNVRYLGGAQPTLSIEQDFTFIDFGGLTACAIRTAIEVSIQALDAPAGSREI